MTIRFKARRDLINVYEEVANEEPSILDIARIIDEEIVELEQSPEVNPFQNVRRWSDLPSSSGASSFN